MKTLIIGNASISDRRLHQVQAKDFDLIIAADGGANHCFEANLTPTMIVGDLDSILPPVLSFFETRTAIYRFPKEKNITDLEIAFQEAARSNTKSATVLAWSDDRVDYTRSALISAAGCSFEVELRTSTTLVRFVSQRHSKLQIPFASLHSHKISIHPLETPLTLKTQGLKWDLNWNQVSTRLQSQSNEALSDVVVECLEGSAFVVLEQRPILESR